MMVRTVMDLARILTELGSKAREDGQVYGANVLDGLYLRTFGGGPNARVVFNIEGRTRKLTADDVTLVRAALGEAGLREIRAWEAVQGASWLSPGLPAGVSFETEGRVS